MWYLILTSVELCSAGEVAIFRAIAKPADWEGHRVNIPNRAHSRYSQILNFLHAKKTFQGWSIVCVQLFKFCAGIPQALSTHSYTKRARERARELNPTQELNWVWTYFQLQIWRFLLCLRKPYKMKTVLESSPIQKLYHYKPQLWQFKITSWQFSNMQCKTYKLCKLFR